MELPIITLSLKKKKWPKKYFNKLQKDLKKYTLIILVLGLLSEQRGASRTINKVEGLKAANNILKII